MRFPLVFFLWMISNLALANDLKQLRAEYYAAVNDGAAADRFYKKLRTSDSPDPLTMAYFGSAQALKARYSWNPYNKLSYLKQGARTLAMAVNRSPDNLEIRFLRFSLEHYVPAFLGYSKHLDEDRQKIISLVSKRQYGQMDKELLGNLFRFMIQTKRCTQHDITILNQALADG